MSINFQYYPKNSRIPEHLEKVVEVFNLSYKKINSSKHSLWSNVVLKECSENLNKIGYEAEKNKDGTNKTINVPVLFGRNNTLEKSFKADAYSINDKTVIEVEAGRAVINNQFLKDLFQACLMQDVDYLCIAVRNEYRKANDFEEVCKFFDALYSSDRLVLPLKGILIIGY